MASSEGGQMLTATESKARQAILGIDIRSLLPRRGHTLAMLNIEPPDPKNSGSNADDPINLAHLLGMLHIVDLIC
jgi:hypothetical protein